MGVSPTSSNNENFGKYEDPVIHDAIQLHEDLQDGEYSQEYISQEAQHLYTEISGYPRGPSVQQALIPFLPCDNNSTPPPTQEQINDLLTALDNFVH